jgi:hypothetical protein
MTIKDLLKLRLQNQQIAQHAFNTPGEVVKWFGAMQAQDFLSALWAVGLRLKDASENLIEKAIADKRIVRTWPMRGTLHLLVPEDVRWMLKLLTPRIIARAATNYRNEDLDEKTFIKSKKVLEKVLQGKQLTRPEVYEALQQNKISTAGQRGLHIIGRLAQEGLICMAARQGKQHTFALLDEWVPNGKTLTHEESLAELAKRYFTSHAPATIQDFSWWSGLTLTESKKAVDMVSRYWQKEMIDGIAYYMPKDITVVKLKSPGGFLLPNFDEYLVAYKDRTAALDLKYNKNVIGAAGNGILSAVIIINGKVAGTWKRVIKKDSVSVQLNPFVSLTNVQQTAISKVVKLYGKFLKMKVELNK